MTDSSQGAQKPEDLKQFLEAVLAKRNVKGDVIFSSVAGSHSFNLAVETSDKDYFGVYEGKIDDVLSLVPPPDTFDSHNPDYSVFELQMFCKLVLKGNPKLIEPLFSSHMCYYNEDWVALQNVRNSFLSKNVVSHYLSYVNSQLKDIQRGDGEKKKKYYHAIRLLGETERIVDGGLPKVWMDGAEREFLLNIRKGEIEEKELVAKVESMQNAIQEKLQTSTLPEQADVNTLNSWLVSLRKKAIAQSLAEDPDGKFDIVEVNSSDDSKKMLEKAEEALEKAGIKATVLFYGPSGSNLHGRYTGGVEDSICIYASPTDRFVSLDPPPNKVIIDEEKQFHSDTYTRGMMLFEIGYAMTLLAQGSHRMSELLWFTPSTPYYSTNVWEEVKKCNLLTVHSLKHYYGIARGSLENLAPEDAKRSRKNKNPQSPHRTLYHVFRCLWCAEAIASGNVPQLENEKDKALLEQLKNEQGDAKELEKKAREDVNGLIGAVLRARLSDFNRPAAGKLLAKIRKSL